MTTTEADRTQSSEAWRRLRKGDQQTLAKTNPRITPSPGAKAARSPVTSAQSSPAASTGATTQSEMQPVASPSPETEQAAQASAGTSNSSSPRNISTEQLRDYVGAFVLAGLDPQVGAEVDFFGDRVRYYDEGVIGREQIRQDLKRYAERWPERRFWLDGNITAEPQNGNRMRVTFPLRYELRNGNKHSSGKVDKTIVMEPAGDDLEIVAVSERKAE